VSIEVGLEYVGYVDQWTDEERLTDEEIVRCRDCGLSTNGGMQCKRHKDSGWSGNTWVEEYEQVDPDGFCAWGERKVVGEEVGE
jgi:hypothetical protein